MSSAVKNQPIDNSFSKIVAEEIVYSAFNVATGALGAHLFTSIPPIVGGIFGLTGSTYYITGRVLDKFFGNSSAEKIIKYVVKVFAAIMLTITLTSLAGYSVTIGNMFYLYLAMIPAGILTRIAARNRRRELN
jgi:predicted anti-sigma-YlaC factor YlaD